MGLQPSASRTALLLACPRPFDPELELPDDESGEAARYGSSFHQVLAACLRASTKKPLETTPTYARAVDEATARYDVRAAREELAGHVKGSVKFLRNWLTREKLQVDEIEQAHAVLPQYGGTWKARTIKEHDGDHKYDVRPGEIPGTVDLVAMNANRKRTVVIDHKTGSGESDSFATPSRVPQMRTLGLSTGRSLGVELGIFHADRRGLPMIYAEPYEISDQQAHADALASALGKVGSGYLRPGPQCKRCQARAACPAQAAEIISDSTAALVASANSLAVEPLQGPLAPPGNDGLGPTLEERAGALYELLKKFRVLEEAGSKEIRRLVKAGAIIETRDGKVLVLREETFETLSKKSVIEALGATAGAKELDRLRKKGAIRESTREKLVPEKG